MGPTGGNQEPKAAVREGPYQRGAVRPPREGVWDGSLSANYVRDSVARSSFCAPSLWGSFSQPWAKPGVTPPRKPGPDGMRGDRPGQQPSERPASAGERVPGAMGLEYGASAVFPCGVVPRPIRSGGLPHLGGFRTIFRAPLSKTVEASAAGSAWTSICAGTWLLRLVVGLDRMGRRRKRRTPG